MRSFRFLQAFRNGWLLLALSGQISFGQGQNLVPNPDFDLFDQCPPYLGQIHLASGWDSPNFATSDYFHACSDSVNGNSVPVNRMGEQLPQSGQGYAGIRLWIPPGISTPDQREYLVSTLSAPLQADSTYRISFFANLADYSTHSTDALGLGLSDTPWNGADGFIPFEPVVQLPTGSILADRTAWTYLSGTYTAQGGEQYLIIGNYLRDTAMLLLSYPPGTDETVLAVYAYIDQVEIVKVARRDSSGPAVPPDSTIGEAGPCTTGQLRTQLRDSSLCRGQGWSLSLPVGADSLRWADQPGTADRTLTTAGQYERLVYLGCDTLRQRFLLQLRDCACGYTTQNVFSPNGDGLNDTFNLRLASGITRMDLRVYDRWGRQVFRSTVPIRGWDGRYRGQPMPAGLYFWQLSYHCQAATGQVQQQQRGTLTLLR